MALLSRMVGAPADHRHRPRRGRRARAAARRPPDLQRRPRRRSRSGPGQGEEIAEVLRPQLANADIWMVEGGIGRGRHRAARRACAPASTTRWSGSAAAGRSTSPSTPPRSPGCRWSRSPPSSPTTASPRRSSSLEEGGRKAAYGVQMPIAVVVDLDYVRASDPRCGAPGSATSSATSARSPTGGWPRASAREPVDGLAVTFARTAATSILHREDGIDDDDFLIALAEALVLSGLAMAPRAPSRPCRGGDHEILHAIDHLYPGHRATTASWPASAACSRRCLRGDDELARDIDACLRRHGLPRTPADLGLDRRAVRRGGRRTRRRRGRTATRSSSTSTSRRGGRCGDRVRAFVRGLRSLSCARSTQPASIFERN